jgi:hypothetical protein
VTETIQVLKLFFFFFFEDKHCSLLGMSDYVLNAYHQMSKTGNHLIDLIKKKHLAGKAVSQADGNILH